MLTPAEIDRIAVMTDAEYAATLADAEQACNAAYHPYATQGTLVVPSMLTRLTGHGSYSCHIDRGGHQPGYHRAAEWRADVRQVRQARSWRLLRVVSGVAVYGYLPYSDGIRAAHIVEIITRGVDCSAIPTPWEAAAACRLVSK